MNQPDQMFSAPTRRQSLLWMGALDGTAILGSLALACLMPFVGLGVAAALTLPLRAGLLSVLIAWAVNQAIGYGLLGFPTDGATILRGIAMGGCALLAFAIGRLGRGRGGAPDVPLLRAAVTFAAAFAGYELAMYACALVLGGTGTFTPAIIRLIGVNDAAWFAGLMALWFALTGVSPARFGRRPALRIA